MLNVVHMDLTGYYSGEEMTSDYLACPSGTFSTGGASFCTICPIGTHSKMGAGECTLLGEGEDEGALNMHRMLFKTIVINIAVHLMSLVYWCCSCVIT